VTLRGPAVAADFKKMVIEYIERRYGTGGRGKDGGGVAAYWTHTRSGAR